MRLVIKAALASDSFRVVEWNQFCRVTNQEFAPLMTTIVIAVYVVTLA